MHGSFSGHVSVCLFAGSIMVTFDMGGDEGNITSTISNLCMAIQNGTHFTFIGQDLTLSGYMTVDGNKYYGVSCGVVCSLHTYLYHD